MIRIWKEGGNLERAGVALQGVALACCFVDIVDFAALPKALDRLVVALPVMLVGWALIFGGQQLRFRKALADAERTKVSSQASGHDRVEPMTPPTLSPTEYAILRNLVVGREVTTIPERLVELGFVRSEKLRSTIGMVKMVWVATRNGRLCIARSEE